MKALYAVAENPLQIDIGPRDFTIVYPGQTFADIVPVERRGYVCFLYGADFPHGTYLSRDDWNQPIRDGDVAVFHRVAFGGGGGGSNPLRMILSIAVMALAVTFGGPLGLALFGQAGVMVPLAVANAVGTAIISIGGTFLLNALIPLDGSNRPGSGAGASPTYTIALQGNSARIDQTIPVLYGHNNTYPDFASQPYSTFDDNDDQFYHACFLIGLGHYDILRVSVDDTPLDHFSDVTWIPVGPGQSSSNWGNGVEELHQQHMVLVDMVSSTEVSGQDCKSQLIIGPFTATRPGQMTNYLHLDMILPTGLAEDHNIFWEVSIRLIDDFEQPIGNWSVLATELYEDDSVTPVRRSYDYPVPVGRYQVSVKRLDERDDDESVGHDLSWVGLRSELVGAGISEENATFVVVRIRASEQLSGLSQRKFRVMTNRKLPIYNGTTWSAPTVTRNAVWASLDALRNAKYGRGLQDSKIDLDSFLDMAAVFDTRQDRFDWSFDTVSDLWTALSLILRTGRAVPILRGGRYTVVRDEMQTIPVAVFSNRNIRKGSFSLEYAMPTSDQIEAIDIEYYDYRRWDWLTVTAQVYNGVIYTYRGDLARPSGVPTPNERARIKMPGIIGENHAKREAAYRMATNLYRRKSVVFRTELDGMLPAYGSLVNISHDVPVWGQNGDIWQISGSTVSTTEPLQWRSGSSHFMRVQKPDGSLTDEIPVTPGATPNEAVLGGSLGFTPDLDNAGLERPRYVFGPINEVGILARVTMIKPRSERDIEIRAVVEDNRVHGIDAPWLSGTPQDLPSTGNTGAKPPSEGGDPVVNLSGRTLAASVSYNGGADVYNPEYTVRVYNDGRLSQDSENFSERFYDGQWLSTEPVSSTVAGGYEVRCTKGTSSSFIDDFSGDALGTWHNLGTDREFTISSSSSTTAYYIVGRLKIEIRAVGGSILDTATYVFEQTTISDI